MRPAFVDTSFWSALRRRRDRRHAAARALFEDAENRALVTTDLVCGEMWTLVSRRASHRDPVEMLDVLEASPRLRIVRVDVELVTEAWAWLRVHDERPYSFVDATSFALMRKLHLVDALAFGGDFAAAGFNELAPSR
ncbi:MAG: type II toxin-antitoxin system VapC family toxin [Gaiella sp.]